MLNRTHGCLAALTAAFALCFALNVAAAAGAEEGAPAPGLTERQKIVHTLNRLGFGARPGDVERVEKMGLEIYVRQQLKPDGLDDAAAVEAVKHLDTLRMGTGHLTDQFFADIRRFIQKQAAEGNMEDMRLRYGLDPAKVKKDPAAKDKGKPKEPTLAEVASWDAIRCVSELQQAKLIRAAVSERQLQEVLVDFWGNHFNVDVRKDLCRALYVAYDRDTLRPHAMGKFRTLLGAVAKDPCMLTYLDNQENSVVREVSGIERKLGEWYVGRKIGMDASGMMAAKQGPNENYARELLELHTLGVDGGYTQKDVQEVARCFSGWGLNPFTGKFGFDGNRHDNGEKTVLGQTIPAKGGAKDGEKVLDVLASHPATAKFVSRKLCQRFVSDDPPAELVERAAKVFLVSEGDVRTVVQTIVTSEEFYAPKAYRAKVKSPFEYAVSAVRATGGRFTSPGVELFAKVRAVQEGGALMGYGVEKLSSAKRKSLNWHVYDMGQPLLAHAAPTGYSEVSSKWVGPGALIGRLNFAVALAGGSVTDVEASPIDLAGGVDAGEAEAVVERLAQALLNGEMSSSTRQSLLKNARATDEGKADVPKLTALVLGSPEFQRR
jgi:uncharacterized protein (DUF1800 family)